MIITFNLSIVFLKSLLALEKCNEIYFDLKLSYSLQIFFPLLSIKERIFADALFYEWSYFGIHSNHFEIDQRLR